MKKRKERIRQGIEPIFNERERVLVWADNLAFPARVVARGIDFIRVEYALISRTEVVEWDRVERCTVGAYERALKYGHLYSR